MNARANREQIVLATKVRYPVGNDSETIGLTPKVLIRELEHSLIVWL